jgi:hypothetical protein
VEIGEFISEELDELFIKSWKLERDFDFYCYRNKKRLEFEFWTAADGTYILKVKIEDENIRKIEARW